jgi:hypothetical protein
LERIFGIHVDTCSEDEYQPILLLGRGIRGIRLDGGLERIFGIHVDTCSEDEDRPSPLFGSGEGGI